MTTKPYLFATTSPFSRENGTALEGDILSIQGDSFEILFASLGAPREKIERIRDAVLEALRNNYPQEPTP